MCTIEEKVNVKAVDYDEKFIEMSWLWLQDEEIRNLTMTPNFTREQQRDWFNELQHRHDYLIWGVQVENKPVGAFGIKNINCLSGEYWGYIGEKKIWGKGIGKWMLNQAITYAKEKCLSRLYLKVNKQNYRAVNLYLKTGFLITASENNILWMEKDVRE